MGQIQVFSNSPVKASSMIGTDVVNQPYMPTQATPVPNLVLAGAHTRTEADVWSIEGAVESGRRAAQAIEPSVKMPQYKPLWLRALGHLDDACFATRLPHVLDLLLGAMAIALAAVLASILHGIFAA